MHAPQQPCTSGCLAPGATAGAGIGAAGGTRRGGGHCLGRCCSCCSCWGARRPAGWGFPVDQLSCTARVQALCPGQRWQPDPPLRGWFAGAWERAAAGAAWRWLWVCACCGAVGCCRWQALTLLPPPPLTEDADGGSEYNSPAPLLQVAATRAALGRSVRFSGLGWALERRAHRAPVRCRPRASRHLALLSWPDCSAWAGRQRRRRRQTRQHLACCLSECAHACLT